MTTRTHCTLSSALDRNRGLFVITWLLEIFTNRPVDSCNCFFNFNCVLLFSERVLWVKECPLYLKPLNMNCLELCMICKIPNMLRACCNCYLLHPHRRGKISSCLLQRSTQNSSACFGSYRIIDGARANN